MAATIPKIDITVWRDIKDYYIINCAAGHTHTHTQTHATMLDGTALTYIDEHEQNATIH